MRLKFFVIYRQNFLLQNSLHSLKRDPIAIAGVLGIYSTCEQRLPMSSLTATSWS